MKPRMERRTLQLDLDRADEKAMAVPASLSSEEPIARFSGVEVLEHTPEAVDLSRARGARLPLLGTHDTTELPPPGRVENVRLGSDRRLHGLLRFAPTDRGRELFEAVRRGDLESVSIGYQIHETRENGKDEKTNLPIFKVTHWQPLEVSLVAVPADATVGIGRSKENTKMDNENVTAPELATAAEDRGRQRERSRVATIQALGERWKDKGGLELARQFIESGRPLEEFRTELLAKIEGPPVQVTRHPFEPETLPGLGREDLRRYSLRNAIAALASGDWRKAGFEAEISEQLGHQMGRGVRGLAIPLEVLASPQRRDLSAGIDTAGGYLVYTEPLGYIDVLRPRSAVLSAGATVLSGLVGNVAIPKLTTGATAYWVAEGADVTESTPATGQVNLSPKTVGGLVDITRRLLIQSTPSAENIVRNDLASMIATALDLAAINGSGVAGQPTGILNTTGIGDVSHGTDGGAPTWALTTEFLADVAAANALAGTLAFVTNAKVQAKLLTVFKGPTNESGGLVWEPRIGAVEADGSIAGYSAYVTNNVPSNLTKGTGSNLSACIFGNWADLVIGTWSVVEVDVDKSAHFPSGGIRVRGLLDLDVAVRHAESFSAAKDIITT